MARISRAAAVRAYWRDHFGVEQNADSNGTATLCREDFKAKMDEVKGSSLVGHVKEVCFNCVGGNDDPGPKIRVRNCCCRDCPLHAVRPWQSVKGRAVAAQ